MVQWNIALNQLKYSLKASVIYIAAKKNPKHILHFQKEIRQHMIHYAC